MKYLLIQRERTSICNVHYFLELYSTLLSLSDRDHDKVFHEFAEFQVLNIDEIPETVWV